MKLKIKMIIVLAIIILAMLIINNKVSAYTNHTANEGIEWVKSQVGKGLDWDGYFGCQCVDLIMYYYEYLGATPLSGNAVDYTWNELPQGWERIEGAQPKKGDILVYTGDPYGHVAIYESMRLTYHQNFNNHSYVEAVTLKFDSFSSDYWGVIRPNYSRNY